MFFVLTLNEFYMLFIFLERMEYVVCQVLKVCPICFSYLSHLEMFFQMEVLTIEYT